ncbi:MAG TPA: LysM peptidoglycan-binding domain-containing protein [Candidatus Cybelea sp.]|jgi:LysM repeat protein|nr:LysM peptidoglycan-binding domain-containing protein [Candidatus Cybelea sp.]
MLLTDLNGPLSLQPRSPGSGRISRPARFAAPAFLFLCFATFGATISRAQNQQDQSVAEAARQERARKQELQKRRKHVYTEEDLKHRNILTPEDRAQIEAKRYECAQKNNCSPAARQNPSASLETPQIPLGDVARQLQKQKELQALKPKQSEPFHLPFSTPALASPVLPGRPTIRPPGQPVLHPTTPSNVFRRRDPFAAVPIPPEVRRERPSRREIPPSVREEVHPGDREDMRASDRENIRPTVRPKVHTSVHRDIRKDVHPIVQPNVHPDFSKEVRPTLRTPVRLTAPAAIRVSPMHPPVLSTLGQPNIFATPAAPVATVRPSKPQPAPGPATTATQKTMRIRPGDSLWKLAQQNLGCGSCWPELMAVNPGIADPNKISIGAELNLPAAATATSTRHAAKTAVSTIKVRKGDTLWSLAKSNLGRASAWPCLAAANPSIANPNRVYESQELTVPLTCKP